MASDEDDDLAALKNAVLATMKRKVPPTTRQREDSELDALKMAALQTKKQDERDGSPVGSVVPGNASQSSSRPYDATHPQHGAFSNRGRPFTNTGPRPNAAIRPNAGSRQSAGPRSFFGPRSNNNLIVIQTVPLQGEGNMKGAEKNTSGIGNAPFLKAPLDSGASRSAGLLLPQDKWASSTSDQVAMEKPKAVGKFSRFESSDSESEEDEVYSGSDKENGKACSEEESHSDNEIETHEGNESNKSASSSPSSSRSSSEARSQDSSRGRSRSPLGSSASSASQQSRTSSPESRSSSPVQKSGSASSSPQACSRSLSPEPERAKHKSRSPSPLLKVTSPLSPVQKTMAPDVASRSILSFSKHSSTSSVHSRHGQRPPHQSATTDFDQLRYGSDNRTSRLDQPRLHHVGTSEEQRHHNTDARFCQASQVPMHHSSRDEIKKDYQWESGYHRPLRAHGDGERRGRSADKSLRERSRDRGRGRTDGDVSRARSPAHSNDPSGDVHPRGRAEYYSRKDKRGAVNSSDSSQHRDNRHANPCRRSENSRGSHSDWRVQDEVGVTRDNRGRDGGDRSRHGRRDRGSETQHHNRTHKDERIRRPADQHKFESQKDSRKDSGQSVIKPSRPDTSTQHGSEQMRIESQKKSCSNSVRQAESGSDSSRSQISIDSDDSDDSDSESATWRAKGGVSREQGDLELERRKRVIAEREKRREQELQAREREHRKKQEKEKQERENREQTRKEQEKKRQEEKDRINREIQEEKERMVRAEKERRERRMLSEKKYEQTKQVQGRESGDAERRKRPPPLMSMKLPIPVPRQDKITVSSSKNGFETLSRCGFVSESDSETDQPRRRIVASGGLVSSLVVTKSLKDSSLLPSCGEKRKLQRVSPPEINKKARHKQMSPDGSSSSSDAEGGTSASPTIKVTFNKGVSPSRSRVSVLKRLGVPVDTDDSSSSRHKKKKKEKKKSKKKKKEKLVEWTEKGSEGHGVERDSRGGQQVEDLRHVLSRDREEGSSRTLTTRHSMR